MTDLADLPWTTGDVRLPNGAKGRKCRRHSWTDAAPLDDFLAGDERMTCRFCSAVRDPIASRRNRANGKRGRRAELTIAREIPGARKMGPLGLPWDVEVGEYARLQVKKLVSRPSANAIRKLIEAIPNTGDRLRGFVWVEAAGQGKRGRREVTFLASEFAQWHGVTPSSRRVAPQVARPVRAAGIGTVSVWVTFQCGACCRTVECMGPLRLALRDHERTRGHRIAAGGQLVLALVERALE